MTKRDPAPEWFLAGFFGYGRIGAPLWLVGMEEHCHDDADAARRLPVLAKLSLTHDLRKAHEAFGYQTLPADVPVWNAASRICDACALHSTLGSLDGDTLFTEVLPLPRPSNSSKCWPATYQHIYHDYKTYERSTLAARVSRLGNAIAQHQPAVVVVHGRRYHLEVERAISDRGGAVIRQSVQLGNKRAQLMRLERSFVIFVDNLGRRTAWSDEALGSLASVVASLLKGQLPDESELLVAPPPIEALLAGMFFHRATNVLPRRVVGALPGFRVRASRRITIEVLRRSEFRSWAITGWPDLAGRTPIEVCMERHTQDLGNDAKRTTRLHKRYGGWSKEQIATAMTAAHHRVAVWAVNDE